MQTHSVDQEWDSDMLVPIVHPDHVQEIMGKYNKFLNKHERSQRLFEGLVPGVMMFADSDHPLWEARRKAVTDIFTKETKKAIADIMFNHVWDKMQGWTGTEVDLYEKISEIQGHLTMEIALGSDVGAVFLDYEKADGSFCKMNVCDYSVALLQDGLSRDWKNLKGLFPYLEKIVKQCTRERDDRNAKRALEAMLGLVAKRQE